MIPQEIIRRKRDGHSLEQAEIAAFIQGLTTGTVVDAQAAAFAMAVFFRGMSPAETVALTVAMRDSGTVLDWPALGFGDGNVVDKHSTGGIGDKVSLMLAPMLAACGARVPMISGRGLGHTGGTLDKMDAIPGYTTAPDQARFVATVRSAGCAIIGQTGDLAPADRKLYAIRDVTATVENLSLITASILSKKLAAGLDGLVMDVKFGSGAFMSTYADALALARSIVDVATGAGVPTVALLTDMNEVLGDTIGNGLEVAEALAFLTGSRREPRLLEVTLALAAEALVLAKLSPDPAAARIQLTAALDDGRAADCFARMVGDLGGPADLLERPERHLAAAPLIRTIRAPHAGILGTYDARELGLALIELGGGRTDPGQAVDPAVGLTGLPRPGTALAAGEPLYVLHARDEAGAAKATARLARVLTLGDQAPPAGPLIAERLTA